MRELMDKQELILYTNGKLRNDTIGRLIRSKQIPFIKFPGIRRYFFSKNEIDRWLVDCTHTEKCQKN